MEALSRGIGEAILIDNNAKVKEEFEKNSSFLEEKTEFIIADIKNLPTREGTKADICYLDPPYHDNQIRPVLSAISAGKWLNNKAIMIVETDAYDVFNFPEEYKLIFPKIYGKSKLTFYQYIE